MSGWGWTEATVISQLREYSRWVCPNGHGIDREPLGEDTLVNCGEFVDGLNICGRRMWRKLLVTINLAS
jgi:hypothetical protein